MNRTLMGWVRSTAERLHLIGAEPAACNMDGPRFDIERNNLLERMHAVYEYINQEAGQPVLDEQLYVQPQKTLSKYVGEIDGAQYEMELQLRSPGLTVRFGRRTMGRYFLGRFWRERSTTKLALSIDPATVSDGDFERWFAYLLSGFRHSRKPPSRDRSLAKAA